MDAMTYDRLRKAKPVIHHVGRDPVPENPWVKRVNLTVPAKEVKNTKGDMALLDLYSKGTLKFEGTGKVCGECVYWYPDPKLSMDMKHGRCKFYGYKQVHRDLSANVEHNYTDPDGQMTFREWPGCPTWTEKSRLSRR
jgi:hypothetical protein